MQPPDDIFFASLVLFDFVEIMVFLNLYNTVYIAYHQKIDTNFR